MSPPWITMPIGPLIGHELFDMVAGDEMSATTAMACRIQGARSDC
jgi:hypothetical protein